MIEIGQAKTMDKIRPNMATHFVGIFGVVIFIISYSSLYDMYNLEDNTPMRKRNGLNSPTSLMPMMRWPQVA